MGSLRPIYMLLLCLVVCMSLTSAVRLECVPVTGSLHGPVAIGLSTPGTAPSLPYSGEIRVFQCTLPTGSVKSSDTLTVTSVEPSGGNFAWKLVRFLVQRQSNSTATYQKYY